MLFGVSAADGENAEKAPRENVRGRTRGNGTEGEPRLAIRQRMLFRLYEQGYHENFQAARTMFPLPKKRSGFVIFRQNAEITVVFSEFFPPTAGARREARPGRQTFQIHYIQFM
jgi:hypothetical protein